MLLETFQEQQQRLEALEAEATSTADAFEARLRRLEAGSAQAQR